MAERKQKGQSRQPTPDPDRGRDVRGGVPPASRPGAALTEQERADAAGGEPARSRFGKTPRWGSVPVLVIVVAAAVVTAIVILMLVFSRQSPVVG